MGRLSDNPPVSISGPLLPQTLNLSAGLEAGYRKQLGLNRKGRGLGHRTWRVGQRPAGELKKSAAQTILLKVPYTDH